MERQPAAHSGVVVVDKPGGMTSHDVVNRLRRIYRTRKVGHAGTLDPIATGVLVVCIGRATRILEYLAAEKKAYRAEATFGVRTDTQDVTGTELERKDAAALTRATVEEALVRFRGPIRQIPPMHSAVHHQGKRLYELARNGVEVERQAREVEIYRLKLCDFTPGPEPRAELDVECSTGTYIRTLIADIGDVVGTGATMSALRRMRVGPFGIEHAHALAELQELADSCRLSENLLPAAAALSDWPQIELNPEDVESVRHGRRVPLRAGLRSGRAALTSMDGELVALVSVQDGGAVPFKVFPASE